MGMQIETQPLTEPITLDEVKAHLRITSSSDDAMILRNITAAREYAEKITRRSLVYKGYVCHFDRFPAPGQPMRLPAPPLVTLTSISYLDTALDLQVWDSDEYFVASHQEPALVVPKPGNVFPVAANVPDSVEVHLLSGYSADGYGDLTKPCPEHIRLAMMQLAGHWTDHPEMTSSELQNIVPKGLNDLLLSNRIYVF